MAISASLDETRIITKPDTLVNDFNDLYKRLNKEDVDKEYCVMVQVVENPNLTTFNGWDRIWNFMYDDVDFDCRTIDADRLRQANWHRPVRHGDGLKIDDLVDFIKSLEGNIYTQLLITFRPLIDSKGKEIADDDEDEDAITDIY